MGRAMASFDAKVVKSIAMLRHRSGSSLNEIAAAIHHLYPNLSPAFLVKIPAAVQQLFAKGVLLRRTTYSLAAPYSAAVGGAKGQRTQKKRAPAQKAKKSSHANDRKAAQKGSRSPAKRKAGAARVRASGAKQAPAVAARKAQSKLSLRVSRKNASALALKETTATKREASSRARAPITSAAHHSGKPRAKKAGRHSGKAHAKNAARHANTLALAPKKTVATKRRGGGSHRRTQSAALDIHKRKTKKAANKKTRTKKAANKKTSAAHTPHHSKGHSVPHATTSPQHHHSHGHRRSARIRS